MFLTFVYIFIENNVKEAVKAVDSIRHNGAPILMRTSLRKKITAFINKRKSGILHITGMPGTGKTSCVEICLRSQVM